jgi:glutamyl-tRNA synthetase
MMKPFITRIAPSPTGMFHLGTARTAYFNWLAARATGGQFILRIDDTDVDRNRDDAVKIIFDSLEWLNLDYDQVYYQSNRTSIYLDYANKLVKNGLATTMDNGAIAYKDSINLPESFHDTISGTIKINDTIKDQIYKTVLVRGGDKSGQPTYNFCSVIDDIVTNINWIIRGQDHVTNTPKQTAIWSLCTEKPIPQFTHIGLIHKDGKKLSKRDNAASLLWYRDQGYRPEAILSFLLRCGWGPQRDDKTMKLITRERALELFLDNGKMRASPAGFDQAKLDNIQSNYEKILNIPHEQWRRNIKKID